MEALTKRRNLYRIRETQRNLSIEELKALVASFTIQEKMDFSPHITKEKLREKIKYLREVQVPNRGVLLDVSDERVLFQWLKNYIHPDLKHWVYPPPKDQRGVSRKIIENDAKVANLRFYENGQQNFTYSMEDIIAYAEEKDA